MPFFSLANLIEVTVPVFLDDLVQSPVKNRQNNQLIFMGYFLFQQENVDKEFDVLTKAVNMTQSDFC